MKLRTLIMGARALGNENMLINMLKKNGLSESVLAFIRECFRYDDVLCQYGNVTIANIDSAAAEYWD